MPEVFGCSAAAFSVNWETARTRSGRVRSDSTSRGRFTWKASTTRCPTSRPASFTIWPSVTTDKGSTCGDVIRRFNLEVF